MRKYYKSVDTLERLIVQRLFELTKLGMRGVGECQGQIYISVLSFVRRLQASREDHESLEGPR